MVSNTTRPKPVWVQIPLPARDGTDAPRRVHKERICPSTLLCMLLVPAVSDPISWPVSWGLLRPRYPRGPLASLKPPHCDDQRPAINKYGIGIPSLSSIRIPSKLSRAIPSGDIIRKAFRVPFRLRHCSAPDFERSGSEELSAEATL